MDPALQEQPHQATLLNTAKNTVILLCSKRTWLAHIQLGVQQDTQSYQLDGSQCVLVPRAIPLQEQVL